MMSKSSDNRRIRTCNRQMDRPHVPAPHRQIPVRFASGIVRMPPTSTATIRSGMSMRIPKMTTIAKMAMMSVREVETLLSFRAGAETA